MIEVNDNKIKKVDIVVGIPSFNEADNIGYVVKIIDLGLLKYFKDKKSVIINVDNNSSDDTRKVFLNTKTKNPKIYISTPSGVKGKGNNLRNLFLKMKSLKAKAGATLDADLKSISPDWIKCLIGPVLENYDYLTPVYHRNKEDGSITNRLCYPMIYGLLGYNIRQPIGGDMAFSKKMVDYWLGRKWPQPAKGYGIDIFMTLNAIKSGANLGQIYLGSKIHKPSAPKLDNMFLEVAETLFSFLDENRKLWPKKIKERKPFLVCKSGTKARYSKLSFDFEKTERKVFSEFSDNYQPLARFLSPELGFSLEDIFLKKKSLEISSKLWTEIVYQLLSLYQDNLARKRRETIIKLLRALYFGRNVSFIRENLNKSQEEAETIIQKEARHFFKARSYLL